VIRLELPSLPPSANNAYFNLRGGGRGKSEALKSFLLTSKLHLVQHYPSEMRIFKPNLPYFISIRFMCERLENAGWSKGKAASRYKKFDTDNRVKFVMDVLKDAGGVDDSQFIGHMAVKEQQSLECTLICVWSMEEEGPRCDGLLRAFQ
jgi:Holliday junction resolvase RusA-like endonuclease